MAIWLLMAAAPVKAGGPAPSLSWVRGPGAESCITSIELAKKVETLLGSAAFVSASEGELVIEGFVNPKKGGGFEARLMVIDSLGRWLGSRDLAIDSLNCSDLNDALALVIAVTINPQSGLAGSSILSPEMTATLDRMFSKDAAELSASEQAAQAETSDLSKSRQHGSSRDLFAERDIDRSEPAPNPYFRSRGVETIANLFLAAVVGLNTGLQPGIALDLGAELGYQSEKIFRVGIKGDMSIRTESRPEDDRDKKAGFRVYSVTPIICPFSMGRGPHSIEGCAGLMVGNIKVKPEGFEVKNHKISAFIVNPSFEFRLKWKIDEHLSPGLGVTALVPLMQHAFKYRTEIGESAELFRMAQIALGANLGLEFAY